MLKRPLPRDRSNDPSHQGQFGQKIAEGRAGGVSGKSRLAFPEFHKVEEAGIIEVRRKTIYETAFFRRSEEHTSELQSLMRISYAVFCLKKKKKKKQRT